MDKTRFFQSWYENVRLDGTHFLSRKKVVSRKDEHL